MISAPTDSNFLKLFIQLKWRQANNHLTTSKQYIWIHVLLGLFVVTLLVGGGTILFRLVFTFLMEQQPFGPALMNRLIKMVLLAFFSMLIFSNFVIMLTTTYISKEVEFLMSLPIRHHKLFFGKLGESIIYSSWAFVLLSFPFFFAWGSVRGQGVGFYVGTTLLAIPYMVIPATMGAALALVVTSLFPPRQMIRLTLALLGCSLGVALLMNYFTGGSISRMLAHEPSRDTLTDMMRYMSVGDVPLLPSAWFGRGLIALETRQWSDAGFWLALLWSTAAMGWMLCDWLAGPLYYRGWCNARSTGTNQRKRSGGLFFLYERLLRFLPNPTRVMVTKDLTIFWRDPSQWGQLVMLFGLLFIYFANLRSIKGLSGVDLNMPFWNMLLVLFNIGATTFILTIVTTRFVFPMLSLEGKQQWVIGLAPVARTHLVLEKWLVSALTCLAITLPFALFSSWIIESEPAIMLLTVVSVVVISMGLTSLSVGLGAVFPNFVEDNPSRIANGLGGTLNTVVSIIYLGLTLTLEGPWAYALIRGFPSPGTPGAYLLYATGAGWLLLHLSMLIIPLTIGLRRWQRMEF